jgi:hypothetical protein
LLTSALLKRLNIKGFRKYSFKVFLEIPAILDLSSNNRKPSKWINRWSGFEKYKEEDWSKLLVEYHSTLIKNV